ncbi:MAG TPA: hypothetical protein VGA08_01160 [Candidatus Saccharimonadales bacterium]
MGVLAVALVFAASNADEVSRWSQYDSDGQIVLPPAGCEIDGYPMDNEPKKTAETPLIGTKSAARQFTASSINLEKIVTQGVEYMYSAVEHFTMDLSGIEVVIHAPSGVEIDQIKFEESFHAPLSNEIEYSHPEVNQLIECFRRDLIVQKKHAGSVYHVHIAPAGHCIKGMRFQPINQVERCDASGATLPQIEVSFLGIDLVKYNLMMLSTPQTNRTASQSISKTLLHETIHAYLTLEEVPLRLDPDEKLVKHVEQVVIKTVYPDGVPIAIKYP